MRQRQYCQELWFIPQGRLCAYSFGIYGCWIFGRCNKRGWKDTRDDYWPNDDLNSERLGLPSQNYEGDS